MFSLCLMLLAPGQNTPQCVDLDHGQTHQLMNVMVSGMVPSGTSVSYLLLHVAFVNFVRSQWTTLLRNGGPTLFPQIQQL